MEIYGLLNFTTKEKSTLATSFGPFVTDYLFGSLACGVYRFAWDFPAIVTSSGYYFRLRLSCKKCDGTGVGEEVSGGHKKECEDCCGSGLDPVKLKKFEELPFTYRDPQEFWTPHGVCGPTHTIRDGKACKKCRDYWQDWLDSPGAQWGPSMAPPRY